MTVMPTNVSSKPSKPPLSPGLGEILAIFLAILTFLTGAAGATAAFIGMDNLPKIPAMEGVSCDGLSNMGGIIGGVGILLATLICCTFWCALHNFLRYHRIIASAHR